MTYITKSCPHCGFPYSVAQPAKSGFYGSPFQRCQLCGQQFIDKDYREIAVSGIRNVDTQHVSVGTAILGVFPFLFMVSGLYIGFSASFDTQTILITAGGALFFAGVLWLVVSEAKGYDERQKFLKKESARSEARLQNPQYAAELKRLGYHVPEKYLRS